MNSDNHHDDSRSGPQGSDTASLAPPLQGFTMMDEGQTFIDYIGPVWIALGEDSATVLLRVEKRHTNPNGTVHGGLLMTLMDITLGSSAQAALRHRGQEGNGHPSTVQFSSSLIGASRVGELLRVEAKADRTTRSLSFTSGRAMSGDTLLMTASAVFKNPSVRAPAA